jgi:hypothetical protein
MQVVNIKEISFKINLRDVLWWMPIKDACKLGVLVIARLLKERCILSCKRKAIFVARKHG